MSDAWTWTVVLAGALAWPAVAIGLGVLWARRRVVQVAARRRSEVLDSFTSAPPPRDSLVQVLLHPERDPPTIAYARHDPGRGWIDAEASRPVAGPVFGWRPDPFPRETVRSYDDMSDDELAREVAALFEEDPSPEAPRTGCAFDLPPQPRRPGREGHRQRR